jgi:5-methylcytosine-specific restriction endonuclease McrA
MCSRNYASLGGLSPAQALAHRRRRRDLARRQCGKCFYCQRPMTGPVGPGVTQPASMMTIDHRVPLARGGSNDADNVVLCCKKCNASKSDLTDEEYRRFLAGHATPAGANAT